MFAYGYEEHKDYFCSSGPKFDYELTIDTAKEISLFQVSKKGMEARRYFIERQKTLPTISHTSITANYKRIIKELKAEREELQRLVNFAEKTLNLPESDHVESLITKHFFLPNEHNSNHVIYVSSTEIRNHLERVTNQSIGLKLIGERMKRLGFKQDNKLFKGVKKRGFYVVSPNFKI